MKIIPLIMLGLLLVTFLINKREQRPRKPRLSGEAHSLSSASHTVSPPRVHLHHPDWRIRLEAVKGLAQADASTAIASLLEALSDSDHDVRSTARQALQDLGSLSVAGLLTTLSMGNMLAREQAATALGIIGDPEAVPGLCHALKDESAWVRRLAAEALGRIGGTTAIAALASTLHQDEDRDVRHAAATSLERIGTSEALKALHTSIRHD